MFFQTNQWTNATRNLLDSTLYSTSSTRNTGLGSAWQPYTPLGWQQSLPMFNAFSGAAWNPLLAWSQPFNHWPTSSPPPSQADQPTPSLTATTASPASTQASSQSSSQASTWLNQFVSAFNRASQPNLFGLTGYNPYGVSSFGLYPALTSPNMALSALQGQSLLGQPSLYGWGLANTGLLANVAPVSAAKPSPATATTVGASSQPVVKTAAVSAPLVVAESIGAPLTQTTAYQTTLEGSLEGAYAQSLVTLADTMTDTSSYDWALTNTMTDTTADTNDCLGRRYRLFCQP
ncbi:MAG: hypothetical protein KC475_09480 [Cyanobacteria bacterium HKST-UBA03]|nr:hypothetical protein [Cyanobacteria bacterium HKST-UBA03]